jgi:histidine triad (HIT) family protein
VFCRIAVGEERASLVHQHDAVVAFLDIQPVNPGHVLVAPRRHVELLSGLDDDLASALFGVALIVQRAVRASGVLCQGVNLWVADGVAAGQEVPHVHIHVVPRFTGDRFSVDYDWSTKPSRVELDDLARRIAARL